MRPVVETRSILLLLSICFISEAHAADTITTVAGNGTQGYSGDGGVATNAQLGAPISVAIDGDGNVYISDAYQNAPIDNNVVRKIDSSGIISTFAGTGVQGYSGDGELASNAKLNQPSCIAIQKNGNVYIADTNNHRIRMVNSGAVITTVVGDGTSNSTGDGGLAINAELSYPQCLAFDPNGNLYISEYGGNRIRKVDIAGFISTYVGNGGQGYSGDGGQAINAELRFPAGLAVDSVGNLYFADSENFVVRKVNAGGMITTVAGGGTLDYVSNGGSAHGGDGGPAVNAKFGPLYGVAVDSLGNVFIADTNDSRVRKVDIAGIISTIAGNGVQGYSGDGGLATSAELSNPRGVATDTKNIYVADNMERRVRKVMLDELFADGFQ